MVRALSICVHLTWVGCVSANATPCPQVMEATLVSDDPSLTSSGDLHVSFYEIGADSRTPPFKAVALRSEPGPLPVTITVDLSDLAACPRTARMIVRGYPQTNEFVFGGRRSGLFGFATVELDTRAIINVARPRSPF